MPDPVKPPPYRRVSFPDVLFRLGGTLMCFVFTGVVTQTIVMYEERQRWEWYVWVALAIVASLLSAAGTWETLRRFNSGW